MTKGFKLHDDLKLGVATAATQIEGDEQNTSWYEFSLGKGNVKDGSTPFRANKHYQLYKEDIALMKKMNIEIYRMGIEWARIEPEEGKFSKEAITHYIDEIKLLKKNNIEVLVTLHHFSNPLWFEKKGAFLSKDAIPTFLRFVEYVVTSFKGLVNEYCTINEANVYATSSYLFGVWPPMKKDFKAMLKVMKTLALCHIEAYKLIKSIDPTCKVGFANHMAKFAPKREKNIIDKIASKLYDTGFQNSLTRAMATGVFKFPLGSSKKYKGNYIDFFGMNYYSRKRIKGLSLLEDDTVSHNDLGWGISPESLNELCERFHNEYKVDIYITENGTCDAKDEFRCKFIFDHLKAISTLQYVKRYYHWTFIDNWEWAEGESARFGLVALDFETQERKIRKSGYFYSNIIKEKEITDEMIKEYSL